MSGKRYGLAKGLAQLRADLEQAGPRPPLPVGPSDHRVDYLAQEMAQADGSIVRVVQQEASRRADLELAGQLVADRAALLGYLDRAVAALATSRGVALEVARLQLGLDTATGRPPGWAKRGQR